MYLPSLFDLTHPYALKQPNVKSTLIAGRWVDNGGPLYPNSYWMQKETPTKATTPSLWQRLLSRIQESSYWSRFNHWSAAQFEKAQPEIVHIHFGNTGAHLLPFLRTISATKIITFYGNDASECLRVPFYQKKYRELFQVIDGVIVLCEAVRQRLIEAGCPPEKLMVWNIPNGVENYPYQKRSRTEEARFLICARFVEKKGYPYLFDAFERLLDSGKKVRLTMLGYGPLNPEIHTRFKTQIKSGVVRVINTEMSADFEAIYLRELKLHDIFVLPSTVAENGDDEGGPALTMISAQASGMPVICTPFPGSEISMVEGKTGLHCNMNDAGSLFEKMSELMANPNAWEPMGKWGSELVHSEFSLSKGMAKLYQFYEERQKAKIKMRCVINVGQSGVALTDTAM